MTKTILFLIGKSVKGLNNKSNAPACIQEGGHL